MVKKIIEKHKSIDIDASEGPKHIVIHRMVVPEKERGKGKGSKFLNELKQYSVKTGKKIALTPSKAFGGKITRLREFYKSHGFKPNKGRKRDFSTKESHIYDPGE